jgi:hypothetical protein
VIFDVKSGACNCGTAPIQQCAAKNLDCEIDFVTKLDGNTCVSGRIDVNFVRLDAPFQGGSGGAKIVRVGWVLMVRGGVLCFFVCLFVFKKKIGKKNEKKKKKKNRLWGGFFFFFGF